MQMIRMYVIKYFQFFVVFFLNLMTMFFYGLNVCCHIWLESVNAHRFRNQKAKKKLCEYHAMIN